MERMSYGGRTVCSPKMGVSVHGYSVAAGVGLLVVLHTMAVTYVRESSAEACIERRCGGPGGPGISTVL